MKHKPPNPPLYWECYTKKTCPKHTMYSPIKQNTPQKIKNNCSVGGNPRSLISAQDSESSIRRACSLSDLSMGKGKASFLFFLILLIRKHYTSLLLSFTLLFVCLFEFFDFIFNIVFLLLLHFITLFFSRFNFHLILHIFTFFISHLFLFDDHFILHDVSVNY